MSEPSSVILSRPRFAIVANGKTVAVRDLRVYAEKVAELWRGPNVKVEVVDRG